MIGCGECEVVLEYSTQFFCEFRGELRPSIGDDLCVQTEAEEYFVEKEGGNSLSSDSFLRWAENYPLTKAVVHHDQERVKTHGGGKVGDEVTRDLTEGERGGGGNRSGGRSGGVRICLVLLTSGAASNEGANIGGEARPSKLGGDQLASFEETRMAHGGMVMTAAEDVAAEVARRGNIDATLISEDAIGVLPVGKMGTECRGN